MVGILRDGLKQRTTHWKPTSAIGGYGVTAGWTPPIVINARWESKTDLMTSAQGEEVTVSSRVFVPAAANVTVGDYLFLGVTEVTDPKAVGDAEEVVFVKRTPSLDGTLTEVQAIL